jgi:hypothetical protein
MKIAVEKLTPELFAEMLPLGQEAWDECSEIKKDTCSFHGERGFKIEPYEAQYLHFAENDSLLAFVLRDNENVLQGYSLALFYYSMHHAPVFCANVSTFYLRPAVRIRIRSFIALMEEHFEARGVVVVGWPVSPSGGLFGVLKALGYAPDDVIMEKRICAL